MAQHFKEDCMVHSVVVAIAGQSNFVPLLLIEKFYH